MRTDVFPESNVLVLYHADCPDGFAAALAAWLRLGERARYLPCQHGDPAPDVTGQHVYILDFSFSEDVLERMSRQAASLTLLDHHVSAQRRLAGFKLHCPGQVYFDLSRSGAVLAWRHFHPTRPLPLLYRLVQDRDLWTWEEPDARDFLAWLDIQPFDFEHWRDILAFTPKQHVEVLAAGAAMNLKFRALCKDIVRQATPVVVAGERGLVVGAPEAFGSDVGNLLASRCGTFGLVWHVLPERRVKCSLRSVAPYEVEPLARRFGGGGHAQASGFQLPLHRLAELLAGELPAEDLRAACA